MNSMGQVCTLTSLGIALRRLYILGSPIPMTFAFFSKLSQSSTLLNLKKRRERKFFSSSLNEKRHRPIPALYSKRGHRRLRNFSNSSTSNLQNTYIIPLMEIIFPGVFGVL